MSKPNIKIDVSDKSIDQNDLPKLLSDSDEDIAAYVDAFFDACVRHDLNEDEAMQVLDTSLDMNGVITEKPRIDLSGFYADDSPHFFCDKNLPEEEVNRLCDEFFAEVDRAQELKLREAIRQISAMFSLDDFESDRIFRVIREATHCGQAADEIADYVNEHRTINGFFETRTWLRIKTGEKTGI